MSQVKNEVKKSTKQDKLVSLSLLPIEHKMPRTVDYKSMVDICAQTKTVRDPLKNFKYIAFDNSLLNWFSL